MKNSEQNKVVQQSHRRISSNSQQKGHVSKAEYNRLNEHLAQALEENKQLTEKLELIEGFRRKLDDSMAGI